MYFCSLVYGRYVYVAGDFFCCIIGANFKLLKINNQKEMY